MAKITRTKASEVSNAQAETARASLPAPGHERREELKRRLDDLRAEAENIANELEVYSFDESALKEDREILSAFDLRAGNYPVSNANHRDFVYCWVYRDPFNRQGKRHIMRKKIEGWVVVQADMPESAEHSHVEGRVIGDTLLMRISRDRYAELERQRALALEDRRRGVTSNLEDLAHKHRDTGISIHVDTADMNPETVKRMENRSRARMQADTMRNQWIREGRMPGAPASR